VKQIFRITASAYPGVIFIATCEEYEYINTLIDSKGETNYSLRVAGKDEYYSVKLGGPLGDIVGVSSVCEAELDF